MRRRDGRTASAIALRPIIDAARADGVDVERLLADLDVPAHALLDPDHRIPDATHARAWREAAARSGDPCFGLHVGARAEVGSYDVLDYALRFSPTLHDAFCRMSKFHRLLCDALATTVEIRGDAAHVRRAHQAHDRHSAEAFFALLVRRAREIAGAEVTLRIVRFTHRAPTDVAPHASFFRCPVRFGCSDAELVFDVRDFSRDVHVPTPGLDKVLDRQMLDLLARLPASDALIDRARRAIAAKLRDHGRPTLATTAHALKASSRTLQRWLEDHGVTHRQLVNDVRRDLALRLLAARQLSITEIAFLLGFIDVGSFRRTVKRWTGETPSSFRAHAP